MIFLYKRCYSKTRNIFLFIKKILGGGGLRYLQLFAYTHAKFEELNVLLTGQARRGGLGIYNSLPTLTPNLRNWTSF